MLQGHHHHTCAEEICPILLQRLPPRGTDTHHHEVLRTASHGTHQIHPTPTPDPFQFAYRTKRSTEDAICSALHPALTHLHKKNSYVRMLFIDFSSAFNTIIPQQLICKLDKLGLSTSICNWLLDFLSQRPQAVRVGNNTSRSITLSTGIPSKLCAQSPALHPADT